MVSDHLIGREHEIRQFDAALAAAQHGRPALIVMTGEAGIGKTRLCEELTVRAREAGFRTAFGACWPDGGAPALWPWHEVLTDLCGAGGAELLDGDRGVAGVDADRFSRFAAAAERLAALCETAPVLVVLDDAHAADPAALLLARFVVRRLRGAPFALVVARRAGEAGDPAVVQLLDALAAEGTALPLGGLDLDETGRFLRAHGAQADTELLQGVRRVTGGNPLFLRQLVALSPRNPSGRRLPDGVRDLVDRVVAGLDPDAGTILRIGAVLGREATVADAAAVARRPVAAVLDAVDDGRNLGFVVPGAPDELRFSHELVREALEASLAPADRLDAHARAARVVAGMATAGGQPRLVRRARHALAAAPRSAEDARRAVDACQVAAADLVRGFAYEQAAALLAEASRAHERSGLGPAPAALLIEWARAVLLYGNLGEARALFDKAARTAESEGDAVLLARAALGLGGVWVSEQRTPDERERVRGLQRRALAQLPEGEDVLRVRLRVRLAAEDAYPAGPVDGVLAALEEARGLGDDHVLAEALSLTHHVLLPPEHLPIRLALADELIRVASAAGDGVLSLMGLCWRAVDLFQLADPRAARALGELRQRADALNCRSVLYIAETMEVMLLIRSGALEEAETRATACYDLGVEVGDADALGYFGGHLVTIRYAQGREAEIVDAVREIAEAPTLAEDDFAIRAAAVVVVARAGDLRGARISLDRLIERGLGQLARSSTWLAGMFAIAEAASALDEAEVARGAYELLAPFADQPVMPSLAVTCFGSTERPLGLAAVAFGDVAVAVAHFERAIAANRSLGNRPLETISRADLADALMRRGEPGDAERATALLERAIGEARAMEMTGRAEEWTRELEAIRERNDVALPHVRAEGNGWVVVAGRRQVLVPDLVGVTYLSRLLANPGVPISALELVGAPDGIDTTAQELLDDAARSAYSQRARDIADDLAEAEHNADLARAERLRDELDALAAELARTTGLGGRDRGFAGPAERARTSVRKAIKRSLDEIEQADPVLGASLRASITTGATCCYQPTRP